MLVIKRGKIAKMEGILLPDGQVMKEIEDRGYRYLGILETDHLKEKEIKYLFSKEYKRRLKLVLKSKLSGKNKTMVANTWAVAILRYSAGVVEWKTDELKMLDRKTRKMMTLYGALHPKSDVDRVYLARQKGRRGLISCEMCVKVEENNLAWYVRNSNERFMAGVRKIKILDSEGAKEKNEFKRQNASLNRWREKKCMVNFCGKCQRQLIKIRPGSGLGKSDLKVETEALIFAAQEQALRTNYVKFNIDKSVASPLCRMCNQRGETINHILSECKMLAQKKYKKRHDNIARLVHWKLCCKYDMSRGEKWYEHQPEGVMENEKCKILWDMTIQCDHVIEARRPDMLRRKITRQS